MDLIEKYLGEKKYLGEGKIEKAKELGAKAFKKGLNAVPSQDKDLMKLLKGLPVGGGAADIMDAWSKAWHEANLNVWHGYKKS